MRIVVHIGLCFFLPAIFVQASTEHLSGLVELQEDVYVGSEESFETDTSTTVRLNGHEIVIEGDMRIGSGTRFIGDNQETVTFASPETVLADVVFERVRTVISSASSSVSSVSFSEYETALTLYVGTHVIQDVNFEGGETAIVYKRRVAHQARSVVGRVFAYVGQRISRIADAAAALDVRIYDGHFAHHSGCVITNITQYTIYVSGARWSDGIPVNSNTPPCVQGNVIIDEAILCPSVIFIPGMQGTRLYWSDAEDEPRQVWEPSTLYDAEYLMLDQEGRSVHEIEAGEPIDELRFVANLFTDPVYEGLLRRLEIHQQQCDGGFAAFGYDWRLPLDHADTMHALDEEVRALRTNYPERKIVFVVHSMGGLIAKQYIASHEVAEVIEGVLFIGTPHVGTPKSYASILHGDGFDIAGGLILTEAAARRIGAFSEAALALFPSRRFFDVASATIEYFGDVLSNNADMRSFLSAIRDDDRESLDTSIPVTIDSELFDRVVLLHESLDNVSLPASIRAASIIGTGLPTLWGLQYRQKVAQHCGPFGGACITTESLEHVPLFKSRGDGTVLTASARYVAGDRYLINLWDQKGSEEQKISHYNITELSAVQECVLDFLDGHACSLSEADTSLSLMTIGIHSPLVPLDRTNVMTFGGAKYVLYPMDGEVYESVWQGSADGSAEISVSIDGGRHLMLPQPVFVSTSTVIRIRMIGVPTAPVRMTVSYDYEADGAYEYVYTYFVSEDRVWQDFSLVHDDSLGICSWLPPRHWFACFFEQLFAGRSMSLIEQTLYDRNVLTGQRQEAVMESGSSP